MLRPALRPALWLFAALMGVDGLIVLNRDCWERHSPDDYAERVQGCRRAARDLLILGGSPVSEGFDPQHFVGLPWHGEPIAAPYSLGLPGGTTTDFFITLKQGMAAHPPPRLVIYGVAPTDLNDARNEPHGPYSVWGWGDWAEVWQTRPEAREWATRRFLEGQLRRGWAVFRYRHGLRTAAAVAFDDSFPGNGGVIAQEGRDGLRYTSALRNGLGYAPAAFYVNTSYAESKQTGRPPAPFGFLDKYRTGSHARYLDKLADWCEQLQADLILVRMPVTLDLEKKYPEPVTESNRLITEFAQRRGLRLLDANRDRLNLTDDNFGDIIHLNGGGAARLSGWVASQLGVGGER